MNTLKRLRKYFHIAVEPLVNLLAKLKITPNMITTSALFFLIVTVYFIFQKNTIISGLMIGLTAVIDALDGALAKKVGSSKFGDFYDAFIDRLVEAVIFLAISIAYPEYYIICFIAFIFSFMTSYVAARAEVWTIGIKVKYLGSIGSRAGRIIILVTAFLLDKLAYGLLLIIIAASITMTVRSYITLNALRKK